MSFSLGPTFWNQIIIEWNEFPEAGSPRHPNFSHEKSRYEHHAAPALCFCHNVFFVFFSKLPPTQTAGEDNPSNYTEWHHDLPVFLLMLLSSHWPETQLFSNRRRVFCACSKGTSAYCTKHDISRHWVSVALGDGLAQFLALFPQNRGSLFCWIHIGSFYTLKYPLALFLCVYTLLPLPSSSLVYFSFHPRLECET